MTALPELLTEPTRAFAGREQLLLIDGERVAADDGRTFATLDPATAQPITTVAQAGAEDIDRAVGAARRALDGGPWPKASAADRARLLNRLADAIEQSADELADLEA